MPFLMAQLRAAGAQKTEENHVGPLAARSLITSPSLSSAVPKDQGTRRQKDPSNSTRSCLFRGESHYWALLHLASSSVSVVCLLIAAARQYDGAARNGTVGRVLAWYAQADTAKEGAAGLGCS